MRRIILAGGSGYLGKILAGHFTKLGWEVVVLTRHTCGKTNVLFWDGATVGDWAAALEDSDAVVNLAGRTVNCRYTSRHQREIYDSRVGPDENAWRRNRAVCATSASLGKSKFGHDLSARRGPSDG